MAQSRPTHKAVPKRTAPKNRRTSTANELYHRFGISQSRREQFIQGRTIFVHAPAEKGRTVEIKKGGCLIPT